MTKTNIDLIAQKLRAYSALARLTQPREDTKLSHFLQPTGSAGQFCPTII